MSSAAETERGTVPFLRIEFSLRENAGGEIGAIPSSVSSPFSARFPEKKNACGIKQKDRPCEMRRMSGGRPSDSSGLLINFVSVFQTRGAWHYTCR